MLFGLGTKAWSAIAASVVMVSAVIAGVAVAGDEDFDPVYAPDWKPGYTFSYDVTGSVDAFVNGAEDFLGQDSADIEGELEPFRVKKEVLNTRDYESTHGEPLYVSAANFPMSNIHSGMALGALAQDPTFIIAERQSDLAPLAVNWGCSDASCQQGGLQILADNPLTYLDFPLTKGKKWVQEEELPLPLGIEELEGISRVHIVGEVGGMESIELGGDLGSTQAVRVDFAYRPVGLEQLLHDYVEMAEKAGMEIERFNLEIGIHETVHYSPEFESIVKQQYMLSLLFDVAVSGEFRGHQFSEDVYAEFTGSIQALLAGSNRAVTEEMTPQEISAKLGNADLINDARGLGASKVKVPYSVLLDPSAQSVNVADGDAVQFSVVTAGDVPAGHRLEYIVRALDGPQVTTGPAAGGFAFVPEEPGVYAVTVRALDADGKVVTTSATRFVEGDYSTVVPASCMVGITGTDCQAFEFPVTRHADSAVFEVRRYGGTPPLGESMYVEAPDGVASGYNHIEMDANKIREMGYGSWAIRYENVGGLLNGVDYFVDVDYRAPQVHESTATTQESEAGGGTLDVLGRMVQSLDGGLAGLEQGRVSLDFANVLA